MRGFASGDLELPRQGKRSVIRCVGVRAGLDVAEGLRRLGDIGDALEANATAADFEPDRSRPSDAERSGLAETAIPTFGYKVHASIVQQFRPIR